ncbi:MAG: fibronectin type III domain-containing protein [Muribaculaceae bacterium]|nr:fibronectin type III domain-containing protein [Muribaculaceae bacterium]
MKKSFILSLATAVAVTVSAGVKIPEAEGLFTRPAFKTPTIPEMNQGTQEFSKTPLPKGKPAPKRLAPMKAAGEGATIFGYLNNTNLMGKENGFYSIDPAQTNSGTFMWQDYLTANAWTIYTGWYRDGRVCALDGYKFESAFMAYAYTEFDLTTGEILHNDYIDLSDEGQGMLPVLLSSAYRTLDDKVYGYGYDFNGEGFSFTVADADGFANVRSLTGVSFDNMCVSLCYNEQDDLFYGITTNGRLVQIDAEGSQTEVFNVSAQIPGLNTRVVTGMVYVPSLNSILWNAYSESVSTSFVSLNIADKKAEVLSRSAGAEIYAFLLTTEPNAPAAAPAMPAINSCDFAGASLSGTLSGTMPTKTQGGATLTGDLDWTILLDGVQVASGKAAAGATFTADLSDIANGNRTFSLIASKGNLKSAAAVLHRWVGSDTPLAPADAVLTDTKVTWTAPTASVHGGYVDFDALTYTVTLNGQVLGTTSDTSLDYTLPQGKPFNSYTAEVTASYDSKTSEAAVSNFITYGEPLKCPIHFRPEPKDFELMTTINVDGHKYESGVEDTWRFITADQMGFPAFASGFNGDDWLILPPINFDNTEKAYRFEMEIGLVHDSDTSGTYEVCIGTAPTAEAMTRVIIPESHCLHMLGDILEEYFAVPEAGVYYIGIHAVTHQVSFHVSDIDITLSDRAADVPTGVTDLQATPGADGALTATVSFKMPLTTADGRLIDSSTLISATVSSESTVPGTTKPTTPVASVQVNGAPGSLQTVEIETAQNYNNIKVVCSVDGRTGKGESTLVYTGLVRPYIVNNLKAELSEDNLTATLTWTPPTEGEEEGPIGDSFYYEVYYYDSSWIYLGEVGWDKTEYTLTMPEGTELFYTTLGVMAHNAAGISYHIVGTGFSIGEPVKLPWINNLDNEVTENNTIIMRPSDEYNGTYWMPGNPATLLSPIFAVEGNLAMMGYTVDGQTDLKAMVAMPKFSTAGIMDAQITFNYWGGMAAAKMRLLGQGCGMEEPVLIAELPFDNAGWTSATYPLPEELQDNGWVILMVDADIPDDQTFAMFSGYTLNSPSGVVNVEVNDADAPVEFYNLQGLRVKENPAPGIYIRRQGKVAEKVVVK